MLLLSTLLRPAFEDVVTLSAEFMTNSFIDADIAGWTVTGPLAPASLITNCAGSLIFGGYQKFVGDQTTPTSVTKTFTSLLPHYSVILDVKIFKIDAWKSESLFVMVDGQTVQTYTWTPAFGGSDICGNPSPVIDSINTAFNDGMVTLSLTVPHTASSATITFVSNLNDQRSEAWGFREFSFKINACDRSCLGCVGPASTDCTACQTIVPALVQTPVGATFSCSCPAATFTQISISCSIIPCISCPASGGCSAGFLQTTYCQPCAVACLTCSVSLTNCVACAIGYYGTAPTCLGCTTGCSACSSAAACTACQLTYFLNPAASTCVLTCPPTAYSRQLTRTCVLCTAPCATCTISSCLSCAIATNILFNGLCVNTCPPPYYSNGANCVTDCSPNAWGNSGTQLCQACSSGCSICPQGQCVQCSSGYLSSGLCVATCPAQTYPTTSTCLLCYQSCNSCSGPLQTQCLTCIPGYYMAGAGPGVCTSGCPVNSYFDSASSACINCSPVCATCASSSSVCTSCPASQYYYLNVSSCLPSCGVLRAIDSANMSCWDCSSQLVPYKDRCVSCHPTCNSCYGPTFDNCLLCNSTRNLVVSACVCNNSAQNYWDCSGTDFNLASGLTFLIIVIFIGNLVLQLITRKRTAMLPFLEFCQLVYFMSFTNILFPGNAYSMIQAFKIAVPWNYVPLSSKNSANTYIITLSGKSGSILGDALMPMIIFYFFLLSNLAFKALREVSGRTGRVSQWLYNKFKETMPAALSLLLPDILCSTVLAIKLLSSSTLGLTVGLAASFGVVLVGSLCWKAEPFVKPKMDVPDSQRQSILLLLSPQLPGQPSVGLFLLLLQSLPPVALILLSDYPMTQVLLHSLLFIGAFVGSFAIKFERRIYRWMVATKYLLLACGWVSLVLAQVGLAWSVYLTGGVLLLGLLNYLGWTVLILLTNLPIMRKIVLRLKHTYNKVLHEVQ